MVPGAAADARPGDRARACDDHDNDYDHAERDDVSGRIKFRRDPEEGARFAYAKGMFSLIRASSVLWTTADFAMWRFSFPLFEESKWRREAC